jgi:hypothetical protein
MYAAMLFMLLVSGRHASTTPAEAMAGMTMGGSVSQGLGGSTPLVTLTTLVFVGVLGLVAARHAGQLRGAIATQRAWTMPDGSDRRKVIGELVLAPGPSLLCQLAMSGTMIYMLVLMVQPALLPHVLTPLVSTPRMGQSAVWSTTLFFLPIPQWVWCGPGRAMMHEWRAPRRGMGVVISAPAGNEAGTTGGHQ